MNLCLPFCWKFITNN